MTVFASMTHNTCKSIYKFRNNQINPFKKYNDQKGIQDNNIIIKERLKNFYNKQFTMSRGSVFKLSGNLALGSTTDTYSTNQLESIKSSLRLLKQRQTQKKSSQQHYADMNTNNNNINTANTYTSSTAQRSQIRRSQNKDYPYYQQPQNQNYQYPSRQQPSKQRGNNNYHQQSNLNRNDYNGMVGNKNDYLPYSYQNQLMSNANTGRNQNKTKTQQVKPYEQQYYQQQTNKNQDDIRPKAQTRPPLRRQQPNNQPIPAFNNNHPQQNQLQQKPIKQTNRQAKQDIVEYDPSTFVQCSVGCGRKFNPDSISKHQAICYKVFQKKRKQFNAQEQRVLDAEHKKIVKNVIAQEKRNNLKDNKKNQKPGKNDQKMSKWKAQSLAFRAMLKDNQGIEQTEEQKKKMEEIKSMGMIKCPHCGRSFNQTAGPKHITFCETQSKKNKLKR